MSREEDLAKVEADFRILQAEADEILKTYQAYHQQVAECVKGILEEANVWEEVHGLEMEREEVRKNADGKINDIRAKALDLNKIYVYLKNLSSNPAPIVTPITPEYPVLESPIAPVEAVSEEVVSAPVAEEEILGEDVSVPVVEEAIQEETVVQSLPVKTERVKPSAPKF